MDEEVRLEPFIIKKRGLPIQLPQDRIYFGNHLIGYVGTQRFAPINWIVWGLADSVKNQVKLVVAERHAQLHNSDKFQEYKRKESQPPKPVEETKDD